MCSRRQLVAALVAAGVGACGKAPSVGDDGGDDGALARVVVAGSVVDCPTVEALGISPAELDVGGTGVAILTAVASVPGGGAPSYSWCATSGAFGDASVATTTFSCTAAGAVTLTLTASFQGCDTSATGVLACVDLDAGATE